MKILVTGGSGFLGSAICRQLAAAGHQPIAFQRNPSEKLSTAGIDGRTGDIQERRDVSRALEGCAAVIHCAALADIWGEAKPFESVNVGGTRNVIDACRDQGVRNLLFTSSPSTVLTGEDIEGGDESLPIVENPLTPYTASKIKAESLVLKANAPGLQTAVLRPHLMWGPGDPHFLPRLIDRALNDRLFLPAPEKKNDFVYVENAARAHVQAIQELLGSGRCAGKVYFVTNNAPQVQGEFVLRLLEAAGVSARIRKISPALARFAGAAMERAWRILKIDSEPPLTRFLARQLSASHWFDSSAARRDFGYVAPISIEQGLAALARSQGKP